MTITQITTELTTIQQFLEITVGEQVEEALERGAQLSVYIARTGYLLAESEYLYSSALNGDVIGFLREFQSANGMGVTALNALIKSAAREEQRLVKWADRLNRTATHQLDWMRTVVSNAKADRYGSNQT